MKFSSFILKNILLKLILLLNYHVDFGDRTEVMFDLLILLFMIPSFRGKKVNFVVVTASFSSVLIQWRGRQKNSETRVADPDPVFGRLESGFGSKIPV